MKPTLFQLNNLTLSFTLWESVCARAHTCVHACVLLELQSRGSHMLGRCSIPMLHIQPHRLKPKTTKGDLECALRRRYCSIPLDPDAEGRLLVLLYGSFTLDFTWVGLIGGGGALRFFGVPLLSELILET